VTRVHPDMVRGPVDVHVHAIPREIVERVVTGRVPGVTASRLDDGRVSFSFPSSGQTPPAPAGLVDFDALAGWASEHGIATQLVGPWTDLFGSTLAPAVAADWCRAHNDSLATRCGGFGSMIPFAMVPLQAPAMAVRELETARARGCRGAVIGTGLPSGRLDRADLEDFWAAASDLRMVLLLHPTFVDVPQDFREHGLKNAIGRAGETAIALSRLVYAGVLARHPNLIMIVAHGGGGFVPLLQRLTRNRELGWADSEEDVRASVDKLYWDSVVLDPRFLSYLVDTVGSGRILLGSDHPFPWEPDPIGTVRRAGLGAAAEASILEHNARELLRAG
jgi:aminocarboxymuconate-semialdehyde decarboxylase